MKYVLIFLLMTMLSPYYAFAQMAEVKGKVVDTETNELLPYASILLGGTTRGTVTNSDGEFIFKIEPGKHTLITRYVGYKTDTLQITVPLKKPIVIKLIKQPFVLAQVIITGEDPAYRIIREAIKRKKLNKTGLKNFEYNMYSKNVVASGNEIALIEETFIKGYDKLPDWEKEYIIKTHRSENLKKNIGSVKITFSNRYLLDFSQDTLNILMNKVFLPLADNAFDYYDYKLINRIETNKAPVYIIKVIPLSKIQPLVQGTIYIEGENYAIVKVDLSTNEGVRFPYIHDLHVEFKQSMSKYDNYWLPDYVEMKSMLDFNFSGLIGIDSLSFHTVSSISDYKINQVFPDSVNDVNRNKYNGYTSDSLKNKWKPAELTGEEIKSLRPIPLSNSELSAFKTLDSTKTIVKMLKPKGLLSGLVKESDEQEEKESGKSFLSGVLGTGFKYLYFDNNRVGDISLGARLEMNNSKTNLYFKNFGGYSFGLKKTLGDLALGYKTKNFLVNKFEFNIYHRLNKWQGLNPYSDLFNSFSVLLGFDDQFNYYLATGFKISVSKEINNKFSTGLSFISEKQGSVNAHKYISIFNRNRYVRSNPLIDEGFDRKIRLSVELGKSPLKIQFIPESGLITDIEFSRRFLGSDFNYSRIFFAGQIRAKTLYKELFVAPYLLINLEGGYINGQYGIQHILSPVVAMGFYSPATSFRGLKPYQYVGDKMLAAHVEHNWRSIIFQSMGLDFLTNLDLDIITGFGMLRILNDSDYLRNLTQGKFYWEAYVGISRILAILRLDFYYNSTHTFGITLCSAVVF